MRFARKVRPLKDIDRYKATELKQILLYTGKLIFKDILYYKYYEHLLCLNSAMSILCSNKLSSIPNMINFANKQLTYFIKQGMVLFGRRYAIYNVHSLSHFKDDVIYQGTLDINSSFKYENYMQYLKHMVRNGKNPMTQIINRIDENIRHDIYYI